MRVLNTTGDAERLSEAIVEDATLELVASELLYPLTVIRLNAEELLRQFQEEHEDPSTADAAQALIVSVERMSEIVQVLMEAGQAEQGAEKAVRYGSAKMRSS